MLDRFPVLKLRSLLFIKLPEKLLLLLPLTKLLLLHVRIVNQNVTVAYVVIVVVVYNWIA